MNADDCLGFGLLGCILLGIGIYLNALALIIPCSIVLLIIIIMIIVKVIRGEM